MSSTVSQAIDPQVHARRWKTLAVLSLSLVVIGLDTTILNIALPTLQRHFNASPSALQWMLDAYLLVFSGLLLVFGTLGDRFGRKLALEIGIAVFGLASVGALLADSAAGVIGVRAAMGIGAALIMPATLSIIANVFSGEERGKAIAIWAALAAIGIGLGPLAGGLLLHWFPWWSVFLLNVPVAAAALALGARYVPESRDPSPGSFDLRGAALSTLGFTALVYGIVEAPRDGWLSAPVLTAFTVAGVLLGTFLWWERRVAEPMVDLDFFRNRRFSVGTAAVSITFFAMLGGIFAITQYLQFAHGYSAIQAGALMTPMAVGLMVGAGSSHKAVARLGTARVVATGMTGVAAALALTTLWTPHTGAGWLIAWFFGLALAMGWVMAPATDAVVGAVPAAKAGIASATNTVARMVAGALGVAIVGSLVSSLYSDDLRGSLRSAPSGATDSIGAASVVAHQLPPRAGSALLATAANSFSGAMGSGLLVAAGLSAVGGALVLAFLRRPAGRPLRVVVVGGGFGGLQAVRHLRRARAEVTLIDRRNFHLFQPLAYRVATGALSADEIAMPLRAIFKRRRDVSVVLGEVTGFDVAAQTVEVTPGAPNGERMRVPYDVLIIAAGSEYSCFGHDDWRPLAPELKSLESALDVRRRILAAFEAAEVEADPARRAARLTFAIVGAGPTGVEIAGQIAEIARDMLPHEFRRIDPSEARVLLVDEVDRVLPRYPATLSAKAERALRRLGVTVVTGRRVVGVDAGGVTLRGGDGRERRVPARTVVWAAGVQAPPVAAALAAATGADTDRVGRVIVEPDLTLPGRPEVIALGDMVRVRGRDGQLVDLPGVAPVAMQQGRYAARLIRARQRGRRKRPFLYFDKGDVATIGRARAVADLRGIHLSGPVAWVFWLGLHIYFLVGFQNRLLVLTRWAVSFVTHGRGARVVTGPASTPAESQPTQEAAELRQAAA